MDKASAQQVDPPTGICHKIRRALALQSFRWTPYHQQDHPTRSSMTSAKPPFSNALENKQGSAGAVPVDYDRSILVECGNTNTVNSQVPVEGKAKNKKLMKPFEGKSSESDKSMNERFSDYIKRTKQTISKTSSDVGAGRITRLESVNKRASAYINRTKQRMKASSGTGGGSFKKRDRMW
uniref:Uncharacterized protein n=1 Tax=Kalanchoe fedtschenkoi TaxID=63787 RepID=A0A7N0T882_KALFE